MSEHTTTTTTPAPRVRPYSGRPFPGQRAATPGECIEAVIAALATSGATAVLVRDFGAAIRIESIDVDSDMYVASLDVPGEAPHPVAGSLYRLGVLHRLRGQAS